LSADASVLSDAALLLLQLETPIETVTAAAGMARSFGAKVILDPAPAPSALPGELCRNVDVLTPNELEAARLLGSPALRLSPSHAQTMADALLASGVGAVIIKLGAQGCLLAQGKSNELIAAPSVDVVDTTAAGDVFNAALAVAMSEHASLPDACRFAVHAAALSVTRLGAQPSMPRRADVDQWMWSLNGAR
jgi:ribokinase